MISNSIVTANSANSHETNVQELKRLFEVARDNLNIDLFLKKCNVPDDRFERQIMIDIFKGKYNNGLRFYHLLNVVKASDRRVYLEQLVNASEIDLYEQISELRNIEVIRGGIYWCDFGLANDSVQGGKRPALVLQNQDGNNHSSTTIVVPLTKNIFKTKLPTHVEVFREAGLDKPSTILFEQIITVSKRQFLLNGYPENIGFIPEHRMPEMDAALKKSVGLIPNKFNKQVAREYLIALEGIQEAKLRDNNIGLQMAENIILNKFITYLSEYGKTLQDIVGEYNNVNVLEYAV